MYLLISGDSCSKINGRDLSLYLLLIGYLDSLLFLPLYLGYHLHRICNFPIPVCTIHQKEIVICIYCSCRTDTRSYVVCFMWHDAAMPCRLTTQKNHNCVSMTEQRLIIPSFDYCKQSDCPTEPAISILPLVPELAHLVLPGRRELATSCSNVLHSVGICLKSSRTFYSLPLGAKVSLKTFQTFSPHIFTSQPFLSPFVCKPPPAQYCCSYLPERHFVPLLLYLLLAEFVSWYLWLLVLAPFFSYIIDCAWLQLFFLMLVGLWRRWLLSILTVYPCCFLPYIHPPCLFIQFMLNCFC